MSEAAILKLADYVAGGVMAVAFFGFLSFVFWLRHVSDTRSRTHERRSDKRRA